MYSPPTCNPNYNRLQPQRHQSLMADTIGIHVNSLKKYEAGQAQPSLDALKKIALELRQYRLLAI